MRSKSLWFAPLVLLLPLTAQAGGIGYFDAYYIPSADLSIDLEGFGSADDGGTGWGARTAVPFSATGALVGEYQSTDYDDFDVGVDQWRAGFAMFFSPTAAFIVEYADIEFDNEPADGFAGHLQLGFPAGDAAEVFARIGYAKLEDDSGEDLDGLEWSVGAIVNVNPKMAALIDYRSTTLATSDSAVEFTFDDLRIGARVPFN